MKAGAAHCQYLPSRLLMRRAPSLQVCAVLGAYATDLNTCALLQAFKAYAKTILTRKNTITGTVYSEDPSAVPRMLLACRVPTSRNCS